MGGGGKGGTSTSTVSIPPEVLARYNAVNARAEEVAQQPFQSYGGEFVAPLTETQQKGVSQTQQYSEAAQPYYARAAGLTEQAAQDAQPLTADQIKQYQNPYIQSVVDPTLKALQQQQAIDRQGQTAQAIKSGAFGGERAGLQRAVTAGQQELAQAQAISPLYASAYQNALAQAQQQQQLRIGTGMQAAQQFAGFGTAAQQAGLQGGQAVIGAGTLGQQTQQAKNTALYQQFLQQRGYDFQTAQFLANIAEGTGALSGSTTTNQQPTAFFSDERLKHDIKKIGKTNDGQPIYSFKYKGDNRTQIGLLAQEVEKKHPEAVGLSGGYKTVDYAKATAGARHARAMGGLVAESMGGAVYEPGNFSRGGFAFGGDPLDLQAILAQQQKSFGPSAGSGLYGGSAQQNPHGAAAGYVPKASLHVPKLVTSSFQPKSQQSELQTAMQGIGAAGQTAETLGKGWDAGKRGLLGAAATKDTPASSGALGAGGKYDPAKGWFGDDVPKALNSNVSTSAPKIDKDGKIINSGFVTDEYINPNLDPTAFSVPVAHGGGIMPRHGYSKGGNPYSLEPDFSSGYMDMVDEEPQSPMALKGQQDAMRTGQLATKAPPSGGSNALGSASQIYSAGKAGKAGLEGAKSLFGADKIGTSTMLGANGAPVASAAEVGPFLSQATPAVQAAAAAPIAESAAAIAPLAEGAAAAEGAGILGTLGSVAGTIGESLMAIFPFFASSDARLKDNIKQVGKTFDGQNIYSYDFGDGRTQMGLLAQEVLHHKPEAVGKDQGYLTVDYRKATEDSAPHRAAGGIVPRRGYQTAGEVPPESVQPDPNALFSGLEEKYQLPSGYLNRTWQLESGAGKTLYNKDSGAQGHFQFLPGTQKMMGLQNPYDLAESADATARLAAQNRNILKNSAGVEDPTGAHLYLAHQQGPAGAARLLSAADRPAGDVVGKNAVAWNAGDPSAPGSLFANQIMSKFGGNQPTQERTQQTGPQPQAAGVKPWYDKMAPRTYQGEDRSMGEFLTSKDFVIPLLTGLGTMASSPSRYLGSAILQGLGGAAQAYQGVQKQQADVGQTVETTHGTEISNYQKSLQPTPFGNFMWLADGRLMLLGEYDDLVKSGKPPALFGGRPQNADSIIQKMFEKIKEGGVKTPSALSAPGILTQGQPSTTQAPLVAAPSQQTFNYGDVSKSAAKTESKTIMSGGIGGESAAKESGKYDAVVRAQAASAAETQPLVTQLVSNLSNATTKKGWAAPGFGFDARATASSALNTISRSMGGPQFNEADTIKDIDTKLGTLMAATVAKGGDQSSFSALSQLRNAFANPNMSPVAYADLGASLMVQNKKLLDQDQHRARYGVDSGNLYANARQAFAEENPMEKYDAEQRALKDLILSRPQLFMDMKNGKYTKDQINDAFSKKYKIQGMGNYFAGGI